MSVAPFVQPLLCRICCDDSFVQALLWRTHAYLVAANDWAHHMKHIVMRSRKVGWLHIFTVIMLLWLLTNNSTLSCTQRFIIQVAIEAAICVWLPMLHTISSSAWAFLIMYMYCWSCCLVGQVSYNVKPSLQHTSC